MVFLSGSLSFSSLAQAPGYKGLGAESVSPALIAKYAAPAALPGELGGYSRLEYGDPEEDAEALKKLSPMTYLDRVKAPLLVIQGVNDPRVPVNEAIQIHDLLEKRGISAPLILFADEGHGASKRANRVLSIGHVIRFFEENLKGAPKG